MMPRGGDEFGCGIILAVICVAVLMLFLALIKGMIEQPLVLACVLLAGAIFMLARREERRERGDNDRRKKN